MKFMSKKNLLITGAFALAATFSLILLGWSLFGVGSPFHRASALRVTCEWARLDPIPRSATNIRFASKGSMFTREFDVSFSAPPEDIERWIDHSPGTSSSTPTINKNGTAIYAIVPDGGAAFAEVRVSKNGGIVRIHTYWS